MSVTINGTTGAITYNGSDVYTNTNITTSASWENSKTIATNYSVTPGNNAQSAGPLTISPGVVVTVPSGSRWVVV